MLNYNLTDLNFLKIPEFGFIIRIGATTLKKRDNDTSHAPGTLKHGYVSIGDCASSIIEEGVMNFENIITVHNKCAVCMWSV
jgi:hypothetical protein